MCPAINYYLLLVLPNLNHNVAEYETTNNLETA